ncbi:MAG: tetratricopeptide repeat protein, partial [Alphaproteobacteria bacterium]
MSRSTTFARAAVVLGALSLAPVQAPPAAAGLPAWLAPIGIALNLSELFENMAPVEAPERRFLDEGRAALDAGDIAAAGLAFETALSANPDSVEALVLLGLIREQQGRPGHAAALYHRALDVADLRRTTEAVVASDADPPDAAASPTEVPPPGVSA